MIYNDVIKKLCSFLMNCDFVTSEHLKMIDYICDKHLKSTDDINLVLARANVLKERYKKFKYYNMSQVYPLNYSYKEMYDKFSDDMLDFLLFIVFCVKGYNIGCYPDNFNYEYFALVAARNIPFEDFDKYIPIYLHGRFKNFYDGLELNSIDALKFTGLCNKLISDIYKENENEHLKTYSLKNRVVGYLHKKLYPRYHSRR